MAPSRLVMALMSLPLPISPSWKTRSLMAENTPSAAAKAAGSPAPMMVRVPSMALGRAPVMGASIRRTCFFGKEAGHFTDDLGRAGRHLDDDGPGPDGLEHGLIQIKIPDGGIVRDDTDDELCIPHGLLQRLMDAGSVFLDGQRAVHVAVMGQDMEMMPGLEQIDGHGDAHGAQSKEGDFSHSRILLSPADMPEQEIPWPCDRW